MTKEEITNYINNLKGYEGYIQYSHRKIDKNKDIFINKAIKVDNENGFVYEAHFSNKTNSISIKQINDKWLVSQSDISNIKEEDTKEYESIIGTIQMAQIWEIEKDELCENMETNKLKRNVFVGFMKGALNDNSTI